MQSTRSIREQRASKERCRRVGGAAARKRASHRAWPRSSARAARAVRNGPRANESRSGSLSTAAMPLSAMRGGRQGRASSQCGRAQIRLNRAESRSLGRRAPSQGCRPRLSSLPSRPPTTPSLDNSEYRLSVPRSPDAHADRSARPPQCLTPPVRCPHLLHPPPHLATPISTTLARADLATACHLFRRRCQGCQPLQDPVRTLLCADWSSDPSATEPRSSTQPRTAD